MKKFVRIMEAAAERKGGEVALATVLTPILSTKKLAQVSDDRFLAQMTRCVFNAGFHWRVITKKWPSFEEVFHQFDIGKLLTLSPTEWEAFSKDARIVRNRTKIKTIWENARMIDDVIEQHGSFGEFFAAWPEAKQIDLMAWLKNNGGRLGGQTGQYFIRFMGKDGFITSKDVCTALRANGIDINEKPTSKRDLGRVQDAFNHWHDETGLPYTHLSKVLAYTVGDNYSVETITEEATGHDT
jgi:3-methyladenine DNA glycosylase Tag